MNQLLKLAAYLSTCKTVMSCANIYFSRKTDLTHSRHVIFNPLFGFTCHHLNRCSSQNRYSYLHNLQWNRLAFFFHCFQPSFSLFYLIVGFLEQVKEPRKWMTSCINPAHDCLTSVEFISYVCAFPFFLFLLQRACSIMLMSTRINAKVEKKKAEMKRESFVNCHPGSHVSEDGAIEFSEDSYLIITPIIITNLHFSMRKCCYPQNS